MRKFSQSWAASILMGLIALAFVFWGIGDIFHGSTTTDVADVGGVKITEQQFQHEYRTTIRNQSSQTGTEITDDMAKAMGLGKQVLDRMITRAALDNLVNALGLTASDAVVSSQIKSMEPFKGPLGTFDKPTFERAINQAGYTEDGFIAAVRADTARDQLLQAVTTGFAIPDGYAGAIFAYQEEYRGADYIVVPLDAAGKITPPTDAQLEAYIKAHRAAFSTPAYREVVYAEATPADVMDQVKVTDKQLKQAYEAKKSTYVVPEKRDIEQIHFKDEASAKAARAKIDAGESFQAVALANGIKPADLSLGSLTKTDLGKARGDAAFALEKDQVSQPVKGAFGWVLLRVTKIEPGSSKTFDQAKPELTEDLDKRLAASKLIDIANAYQDAVDSGFTLTEAAKKAGMHVVHIPAVDSDGMTPAGKKADLPDDPELLEQAFKAEIGDEGEPFQTKKGNFFAVKVNGVTPPKPRPLAQIRERATQEWMARAQAQALQAKAESLAEQATKAHSLEAAAKSIGAKVLKSPALQRDSNDAVFSPAVLEKLFAKPAGTAIAGPAGKGDSYIVALTTGVIHPRAPEDNPAYQTGVSHVSQVMANDLVLSLAAVAKKRQGSEIYPNAVNSVTGAGNS